MIDQQMIREATEQAEQDMKFFPGLTFTEAFANALRGFRAAREGYDGQFVQGRDRWA